MVSSSWGHKLGTSNDGRTAKYFGLVIKASLADGEMVKKKVILFSVVLKLLNLKISLI